MPAPEPGDEITVRLERIEAQLADFHRRSAHREAIIDRLHAENQQFRDGVRRVLLEPVVTDLLRLYDSMTREALRLAAAESPAAAVVASFADEVELAVERCGYQLFPAEAGTAYQSGRHAPAGTVTTDDPALDNTVAEPLGAGLQEIETGQVRRPSRARFYRYRAPAGDELDVALDEPAHTINHAGRD
jgi:molecular chaperone GrpE (heat shock protein)